MKKMIVLFSLSLMFLFLAKSVSADKKIAVIRDNNLLAVANTGNNLQGNTANIKKAMIMSLQVGGDNFITTGQAQARSRLYLQLNSNLFDDEFDENEVNFAMLKRNVVDTEANSGLNSQGNGVAIKKATIDTLEVNGGNNLTTGEAKIRTKAWIVVNSNWLY